MGKISEEQDDAGGSSSFLNISVKTSNIGCTWWYFVGKGSGPPTHIESVHPYDQSVRACGPARDQEVSFFEGSFRLASSEGYGLAPLPTQHTRFPTGTQRSNNIVF